MRARSVRPARVPAPPSSPPSPSRQDRDRLMPASKETAKPIARSREELDPRIVRALSHPIRHRVLVALNERGASPKELAAELGEPLGNVSYHTRVLAQLGCIELVSTTQRRGALEHHYRAVMRPFFDDAAWAQIPASTRRSLFHA